MIFSKRKTIAVFVSKMFKVFDEAFFAALDRESRRLDYDMAVFVSAGYYQSTSDYDIQEKNIINFFPLDRLVNRFGEAPEKLNREENRAFPVRASAGFTVIIPGRTKSIEDCVRESDRELYRIKAEHHSV